MSRTAQRVSSAALIAVLLALAGCGDEATQSVEAGMGPSPNLPKPNKTLIPTVNIAPAKGWPPGAAPQPANGLAVTAFADGLVHPRWLYVLPNGDTLVAETDAPVRPAEGKGVRGWIMGMVMERAGSHLTSADRITLLRDANHDGIAETRSAFLENLHSPFGMALVNDWLYVANADAVVRVPYHEGDTRILAAPEKVVTLPGGPINHHWTKSLIASPDGRFLYIGVGSNSNVAENGIAAEEGRAAIWEIEIATGRSRIFASGLRNPVGMAFEPTTGVLWTAVNERDELGSDLVPDYMTSVKDGGFYGWPYSYYGNHVDERVKPQRPDLVEKAIVPDYALGPHTASLGLAMANGTALGDTFQHGAVVGQHGSWNRKPLSGYKVIFVPFQDGRPVGKPIDVLSGFINANEDAMGRPVGVVIDKAGGLLVADDVGNRVWRVTSAQPRPVAAR
jgi:glucose/arabinose dehydrogenase